MSSATIPRALREKVATQARHRCGYCLTPESIVGSPMQIEHIIPEADGGLTIEENLWLACGQCNSHKSDRTVGRDDQSETIVRLFNPRLQEWSDHFCWSEKGDTMIGKSSVGRVTVIALHLNRPELVAARRLWVSAGWHPPKD